MYSAVRETHSGVVFLCGDRAYKAKKPIATDFLDFSTRAARKYALERELVLNRRLAADVYLGVAELTDPEGGPGEPILVMRRMPDSRRLSTMITEGSVTAAELSTLAMIVADFHRTAERGDAIDSAGTPNALRRRWSALLQRPQGQDADPITRVEELALRFIDGREALFADRIAAGRILDGHGDLLTEDIFALPDGFRILDCLDFDDELRYVDGLDDIAFLAMDIEFLGHPDLARTLLTAYLDAAGDAPPDSLSHHYLAYRAMVRAKTDRIRATQGDTGAADRAHRHIELALGHLEEGAVRMVLIGGLPGTGKSTVARELADRTGAEVISTDGLRAALRACGVITGTSGDYGAGAYQPAARAVVYAELLEQAGIRLERGVSVILDASWLDADDRAGAAEIAKRTHAYLLQLHCVCPRELATTRMEHRTHTTSDATPDIAKAMAAVADPWPGAAVVDTGAPLDDTVQTALRHWRHSTGSDLRHA
ncbi:AAA family ATPase [Nocardia sp. SYP-A9097]|uniref:bifunctional aminoglycoside phosphotransferase/ATP-binding protein n=1 Tax=Nocardia sp. SYP-A9097 TaxID=2663237 RepID=UPI00129AAEF6|nr:AAA family ATPase [Nocardia sp. SYP-A9097]MRH87623.1 AAA family ATPase [Nocardia sp. SYP-A9097]